MKWLICLIRKHQVSLRCRLTEFRPVVEYQVYCRRCGKVLEKVFTLEYIPPDVRRSQLTFTLAKYADSQKVQDFLKKLPLSDYYDEKIVRQNQAQAFKMKEMRPDRCIIGGEKLLGGAYYLKNGTGPLCSDHYLAI